MQSYLKAIVVYILRVLAQATVRVYKPKIIAVTGNVGKTSTKDAIFAALATTYSVRKSHKSFNSEIGVPLTILGEDNPWGNPLAWAVVFARSTIRLVVQEEYPTWLVLEVGADAPGDIQKITEWLTPDIVVLTQFGETPVHIENFKNDRNLVVKEKSFLPKALPLSGTFVYYGDDPDVVEIAQSISAQKISFGTQSKNDVRISEESFLYSDETTGAGVSGIRFRVSRGDESIVVERKGYLGRAYAVAAAAGYAVASLLDVSSEALDRALSEYTPEPGRMRILDGLKGSTIIDDTYNAAPKAVKHALDTLQAIDVRGKKIALLGDMLELGKHTEKAHKDIGKEASQACHTLVTVGLRARFIAEGALHNGMSEDRIFQFEKSREAGKFVETLLASGDVVLVKGSQGMRMERAVEEMLLYPDMASDLLVRQSEEWKRR